MSSPSSVALKSGNAFRPETLAAEVHRRYGGVDESDAQMFIEADGNQS